MTSDEFLCALLVRRRGAVVESFIRAASRKKNPPVRVDELADRLAKAGVPQFAGSVKPYLGS